MLRSHLVLAALATSTTLVLSFAGCGGADNEETKPPVVEDTAGLPPPAGPNHPGDGTGSTVFAISKLYLGDTDRAGVKSAAAWKSFGFNLDGKVSTESSTDLCKPRAGGKKSAVYPDGNHGIDNSFGKNILPIITGVAADASTAVNEGITKGSFTIMLSIEKLGAGADYNPLTTKLYGGADLGHAPAFNGTDEWPVLPELLDTPTDIESAKVQFKTSYVTKNTWVSGSKAPLDLTLGVAGFSLTLQIGSALVAMDMDEAHTHAKNGVIAGVIDTEAFITELKKVAGAFSQDLCSGSTIESIANQLRQASDIMRDGSAGVPTKECDGISIGIGFDMATVKLGKIADPAMPQKDPCAGTGGGGGSGAGAGGGGGAGGN